ncbi:MAG TPA: class I SAM-dependent methyltransferase [Candidatus Binatia bacterium]|nr:class I SAM-dependent methyltransferase [Candidatus Binatia bacterium]
METALYSRIYAIEEHYWWSAGTRAIFHEWLARALGQGSLRPLLLDVGCGSGIFVKELASVGTVHGMDVSPEAIALSHQRGIELLCLGTAERLPYASGRFDAVAAVDVVEHVDDRLALAEIARVLKPGGVALVHAPAFPFLWGEHDVAAHHRRRYRRAGFCRVVEESGLRIERLSYVNLLVFPAAVAVRVGKRLLRHKADGKRPPSAEIFDLPRWLNGALTRMLALERLAMRRVPLPIGVSLLCLARKAPAERSP